MVLLLGWLAVTSASHCCVAMTASRRPLDQPRWLLTVLQVLLDDLLMLKVVVDYQVLSWPHLRHEVTIPLLRVITLLPRDLQEVLAEGEHLTHVTGLENASSRRFRRRMVTG